jgi:hypothetical protein
VELAACLAYRCGGCVQCIWHLELFWLVRSAMRAASGSLGMQQGIELCVVHFALVILSFVILTIVGSS